MQFNQNSIQPTPTSALMSVVDTQGTNLGLDSSLASPTSGSADVWPLTRETPRSAHITIYESSIAFLREACCRTDQDTSILHQLSLIADDIVSAIIESVHCRRVLLQLSSEIGLANNSDWRNALQLDERRIATHLETIFSSKSAEGPVLVLKGESAQCFLDVVQDTLNRGLLITPEQSRRARRIIRKLSEASDSLPSSLFVTAVSGRDPHPLFAGGYGDIYRAEYKNKTVALKHMRYFTQTSDLRGIRLKLCREALVWKDLHHSNILTFIGIDRESFPGSLCLVSPWMEHGTVLKYLNDHGLENVDKLLFEIAQGLEYLHSHNVVHGDLRGTNILIKDDWSACLADFGLSVIVSATASVHTSTRAGSPYWMAPELIDPARFGCRYARTPASDVYAFGCVCLELYTGRPPFSELSEVGALLKVINGERAERSTQIVSDLLWQRITSYWAQIAAERPLSETVAREMTWPPIPLQKSSSPAEEENSVIPEIRMTSEKAIARPFDSPQMGVPDAERLDVDKDPKPGHMPAQPLQAPIFAPAALPFRVAPSSVTLRDKPLPAEPPGSLPLRRDPSPETLRDAPPALNLSPRRTSSRDQSTHPYSRSNEGPLEQAVDDGTPRPRAIFKFQSMKKLFGLGKSEVPTQQTPITTPIHQQFAFNERARGSPDDDRWEFLDSQQTPPAVTACRTQPDKIPDSIHHPSPPQTLRKKAPPPAVNLLNALEPTTQQPSTHSRNQSEKRPSEKGQEKSGGFGGGGPDEEKEKEREHEMDIDIDIDMEREREVEVEQERERERRDEENELTRKIGFLTATASEDWTLALDVCEHASANENNAREAVRALRREFKYGEPAAQAAAARLWAIMLRNSSGTQCTTRKFLDAVEMVLTSARTTPVVRERLMVVLAAAAYASGPKKESGFRGLWRRVKPRDKPEEGVPLDTDDAMFNPPLNALRHPGPGYEFENTNPPVVVYPDGTQTAPENPSGSPKQQNSDVTPDEKSSGKSHRDHFRGILPPDEDTRRLFQECKIGVDNAFQLSEALATATPEELRNPVISEFYTKCVDSQMLIMTQIPWASAGAERSRAARNQTKPEMGETKRKTSATSDGSLPDIATAPVSTYEEELLADLLTANEHLLEAIDLYMDLERVALERETGQRSQMARRDTNERADRREEPPAYSPYSPLERLHTRQPPSYQQL